METQNNQETNQVAFEPEGKSFEEAFLRQMIKNYENAWNHFNKEHEVKFKLSISTHNLPTPEGNKDFAYLRLDKFTKTKGVEEEPTIMLIHQEVYKFSNIKERVNPTQMWKQTLFLNCTARLIAAGLEYAELLKRVEQTKQNEQRPVMDQDPKEIVMEKMMPQPLSPQDEKYKEWLKNERAKEGLTN